MGEERGVKRKEGGRGELNARAACPLSWGGGGPPPGPAQESQRMNSPMCELRDLLRSSSANLEWKE